MSKDVHNPLVSIITVVYNGEKYLEDTILSVINQTYKNIEYIIIDGGSTDSTVDIIKKYENNISYWISESDNGIYNAWNKGLKVANGDIISFLNADDYYDLTTLQKVTQNFKSNVFQLTYGITQFINDDICTNVNNLKFNQDKIYNGFGFMHTTVFASKEVYQRVGTFDENFRIAGDVDWLTRAYKQDIKFLQINNLTYMRDGGISDKYDKEGFHEFLFSLEKNNFDKKKILLAKNKRELVYIFNRLFGKDTKIYLKQQFNLIVLKLFNTLYNVMPFFTLKKRLLKLFSISIGNSSYIHTPVTLFSKGRLIVGNNSTVNHNCYLDNRGIITIGNNVSIAHNTKIYTAGHDIHSPCFTYKVENVIIEDNVVIFSNVLIMPGVKIGKNAVIYAGSVVTKNIAENSVVGGNPAKHIKYRNITDIKYKIDYSYWFAQ